MQHDIWHATEILLATSREYGSGNATSGDVAAAAFRFVAAKLVDRGYTDLAKDLERYAVAAEKSS